MRICTDSYHTRATIPFSGKITCSIPTTTNFKVVCNIMFMCKITNNFSKSSGFNIFIWCKMVRHKSYFCIIKNRFANFFKFFNCRLEKLHHLGYHIKFAIDELSGFTINSSMFSQNFFGHSHTHENHSNIVYFKLTN